MCERDTGAVDLAFARAPLQLLGELDDLRDPGCADRVTLTEQTAGRVDRNASAQPGITSGDEATAAALHA